MSTKLRDEIYNAVLDLYSRGYRVASAIIGAYYFALIPIHFVAQPPGVGAKMVLANIVTGTVFILSSVGITKGWIKAGQWPLVAVTCLLIPTANHLILMGFTHRLELTGDLMLIMVAASVVSPRVSWHLSILGICLASWAVNIVVVRPPGDYMHWGIGLLSATLVSFALHSIVSRLSWMQARLRVKDAHLVQRQKRISDELRHAMQNLKTLQGLIPMCGHCKKIRDDGGYWNQVESYLEQHSTAEFTHGLCPDCEDKLRAEFEALMPHPEAD